MDMTEIKRILERALANIRLTAEDCTALLESHDIAAIGAAADEIRQRRHPDGVPDAHHPERSRAGRGQRPARRDATDSHVSVDR